MLVTRVTLGSWAPGHHVTEPWFLCSCTSLALLPSFSAFSFAAERPIAIASRFKRLAQDSAALLDALSRAFRVVLAVLQRQGVLIVARKAQIEVLCRSQSPRLKLTDW